MEWTFRDGTYDRSMVRDGMTSYRRLGIQAGDTVLDLGAHIGGFSVYACLQGAARVVAYEPEPSNAILLRKHVAGLPVEVREKAVLAQRGIGDLHATKGVHTGHHSMVIDTPFRFPIAVEADAFRDVLTEIKPDRVKVDIEGAEHELEYRELPDCVRGIAIEFEKSRKQWRRNVNLVASTLENQGFVQHRSGPWRVGVWTR